MYDLMSAGVPIIDTAAGRRLKTTPAESRRRYYLAYDGLAGPTESSGLVGDRWPSMRGRKLAKIVEKHCVYLRSSGGHRRYRGKRKEFTFSYHDGDDITGNNVRRILIEDIGLSEAQARKEVS